MRLRALFWILPVVAWFMIPPQVAAQQPSGVYVTPYIGVTFPLGNIGEELMEGGITFPKADLDPAPVLGANLGYRFGGGLAIEGMLVYIPGKMSYELDGDLITGVPFRLGFDLTTLLYGANLTYYFGGDKTAVVPFVTGGAGGLNWSTNIEDSADASGSTSELFFNLGVGLEIPIREKIYLRYTLIDYFTSSSWDPLEGPDNQPDQSNSVHYISLLAGMSFYF